LLLLDIQEVATFTDYFIIANGTSDRMLDALANVVRDAARDEFKLHSRFEGRPSDGWVVVDFGDIVVHLFSPDQREYYQLEKLWEHGKVLLRLQ
jgi:ribosome-associated protein